MRPIAGHSLAVCLLLSVVPAGRVSAQSVDGWDASASAPSPVQQRVEDAWWTGPLIANSPSPLPKNRVYVESYLYDVKSSGIDGFGSQTYLLYGLSDRLTVGMRPLFGYTRIDGGGGSSRIDVGDLTLHTQYALTTYTPGTRTPAIAIEVDQTLPIGRYDRLDKQSNGFGSGAYTTTLGIYAQQYFWLRNGRILRGRLNLTKSFSSRTKIRDLSVYGTSDGFDGNARPGSGLFVDNAWEYSLTRNWALAVDFYYRHDAPASIHDASGATTAPSRAFDTFAVAPAIEYNWSARVGVIFGTRFIAGRGNNPSSITPIVALSVLM